MKRLAVSLFAVVAAMPAQAHAQDIELAEIVISALRTAADRLRTGVSISVVDEADLAAARDASVAETLARLPGVSVAQSGPFGSASALRVRGADGRYLAVFVDGIKVSDPSGVQVTFDWGNLMTSDISRVEVLRGSQSALWGGSAVGGVINITTRTATEDGLHQTVTAEGGSYGSAKLSYGLTQKTDRSEIALTATRLHTRGFSAFDGGTEDDGADATRLSFSSRYKLSDTLTLGGALFWQDTTQDYDGYTPAYVLGDLIGYSQNRRETGARVFAELAAGATLHLFEVSVLDVTRSFDEAGSLSSYGGKRLGFGWQGTTELSPTLSFVYGADWSRESADYTNLPGGSAATTTYGAFAQAIWAPSNALDISATLRADHNSGFGTFPTGRLAVAWHLTDSTTLHAAYATGFRAPSIDERFGDYPGFFPFIGNPDLQPEDSTSYELGVEQAFASGASLSATLFQLDVDNLITYQFGAPSTLLNLPGVSTRKGLEVAAALPVNDAVSLGLAYTYTDGRRPDGARLQQVPYHQLALTLDADLSDRLSAGLALTHVAGRIDNDANTFAPVVMPDYTVLAAQVSYDLNDATEVYLKLDNLTDEDYQQVNGYATAGRSVYLGLQAKF